MADIKVGLSQMDTLSTSPLTPSTLVLYPYMDGLDTYCTDIGNVYLEANTSEKVCFIAGNKFGALQGHLMIIVKALYRLCSSRKRWHEKFADTLIELGFFPCKAEPNIWMQDQDGVYEYIIVYGNGLAIVAKDPQEICDLLVNK